MQALAAAGDLAADAPVRAITCNAWEALEISLAENVTAEAMHPVDEFEAYNALVSDRVPVAEIAARFGKTDAYVRQRMALARVSPRILQAYREEDCTFETVAAFTVSDDHARQDEVWASLNEWNRHPQTIKRLLSDAYGHQSASTAVPPLKQLDVLVETYGGGPKFEAWSAALAGQSERGLLVELSRLRSMTLTLRQALIEQQARTTAVFGTMLATQAGGKL